MRTAILATLTLVSACSCSSSSNDRSGRTSGEQSSSTPSATPPGEQNREAPPPAAGSGPVVRISTSMGDVRVRLDEEHAPTTVRNFLRYAEEGFYEGTIFHRVIDDFMIQGGGFTPDMQEKPTHESIPLEIHRALRHVDGAIAMARTSDPNSASAQFYICDGAQHRLDDGYAAFGVVIEGMDVVHRIAQVQTGERSGFENVPVEPVMIVSVRRE